MRIIIDYKFENVNTYINKCRTNIYYANQIKQKETQLSSIAFKSIPKIEDLPIELTFRWHIKNKLSDLDGKIPKNIIDGLVRAEKIPDDNVKYIQKITHIYVEDTKDYVEIDIEPLKEVEIDCNT